MQGWLLILLRSILMFFITLILIRVLGKRQPARMNPFSFVNYTVIAIITALTILNILTNFAFGLIALGIWVLFPIALDYLALKSKWVHDLVNGKETILIKQGKIMEDEFIPGTAFGRGIIAGTPFQERI